ncbi:MAG TPA: carboxypeptidase-like regulatory domain-containing protein [Bryobacteraceae bacterium]|jgi:hypothetical protein
MTRKQQANVAAIVLVLCIVAAVLIYIFRGAKVVTPLSLTGVVLVQNSDPRKQAPIADAAVTATNGVVTAHANTDSTGLFRLTLDKGVRVGQVVRFQFRRSGYFPLDLTRIAGDEIYIARMLPLPQAPPAALGHPVAVLGDVQVRYSEKATTIINVGSMARAFEIVNTGNVRCNAQGACSPDGKWRATIGSLPVDAGAGSEFQNVRLSCIAGPCAFTRIESEEFTDNRRSLKVSVRNWSDTTTYLLEAEVVQARVTDVIRHLFPAKFGPTMNFTLPAAAEGPSIEADMNGQPIVYPLGPALILSWATCTVKVNPDRTKLYRCELKPGYRFE